jgi:hypothetical protein
LGSSAIAAWWGDSGSGCWVGLGPKGPGIQQANSVMRVLQPL